METASMIPLLLTLLILSGGSWHAAARADSGPPAVIRERDAELARGPSWRLPSRAEVQARALAWAAEAAGSGPAADRVVERVVQVWVDPDGRPSSGDRRDLVDAAMETAAIVDPRVAAVRGSLENPGGLATA
ncbi:MAG: hypothetical protein RLZZ440_3016, partial [Planctomycetota bacterium]